MIRRRLSWLVILIIISLLGISCRGNNPPEPDREPEPTTAPIATTESEPTTAPTATAEPEPTTAPTAISEPVVTATLTAEPEADPSATPTAEEPSATVEHTHTPTTEPLAIVVGSKTSTEQLLLGKMLVLGLQDAGYDVVEETDFRRTGLVREALEAGEIDLYWEYIGTALSNVHNLRPGIASNPDDALDIVRGQDEAKGLKWEFPLDFNNPYTLFVHPAIAIENDLETLEDLALLLDDNDSLKVCSDVEFKVHLDGFPGLQGHYDFEFKGTHLGRGIDLVDQIYEELDDGKCDVAAALSTDSRIRAGGFHQLEDTKQFFSSYYNPAVVIREEILRENEGLSNALTELLKKIRPRLNEATMRQLNACVDIGADEEPNSGDEESVEDVADAFLFPEKTQLECLKRQIVVGPVIKQNEWSLSSVLDQVLVYFLQQKKYDVVYNTDLPGTSARQAIKNGEIDLYWESTRSALDDHQVPDYLLPTGPDGAFDLAKNLDQRNFNLRWLDRAQFNNTLTLLVQPSTVEQGIGTIEQLADFMNENNENQEKFRICVSPEFNGGPHGLPSLQGHYGFQFKTDNIDVMPLDQTYTKLREGGCDVAFGFSTDSRIDAWGFHRLKDTLQFFPANVAAPVIRQPIFEEFPELQEVLTEIAPHLDNRQMSRLNAQVEIGPDGEFNTGDEETVERVAKRFVEEEIVPPPPIVVGSKGSEGQRLLAKMLTLILQEVGFEVEERTDLGDTLALHQAMQNQEIDLYWESTASSLINIHSVPRSNISSIDSDESFRLAKTTNSTLNLVWLEPADLDETYTLMVQQSLAEQGIRTLDDLANFMNSNDAPLTICVSDEFYDKGADDNLEQEDNESEEEDEDEDDEDEDEDEHEDSKLEHDGFKAMLEHYEFKEQNIYRMSLERTYEDLRQGRCDVAQGLHTDARIEAWGFHELEDTREFFPLYIPAPVIREDVLEEHLDLDLEELLSQIGPLLDEETMIQLNQRVTLGDDGEPNSQDDESAESVARDFLCQAELLKDNCPPIEQEGPNCRQLVLNGGFESEAEWELPPTNWPAQYTTSRVYSDQYALRLGIDGQSDEGVSHSAVRQRIAIPEGVQSATLSYWYYAVSNNLDDGDLQGALIYNSDLDFVLRKLQGDISNEQIWRPQSHDLSDFIGDEIYLYFYVINDGDGQPSAMYLDDVSLQVCDGSQ